VHHSSGIANRAFYLMSQGFNTTCNTDGTYPAAIGEWCAGCVVAG